MDDDIGEEYDDFLFESIRRYDTLQMFNLQNVPTHIIQINNTSLCLANKLNKGNNSELLNLKIPTKLTLPPSEEGRCKENDFKVLSGLNTENLVYKVGKLGNGEKIITSEYDVSGLRMYTFQTSTLGTQNGTQKLDITSWQHPEFIVNEEANNVICSKCNHEPIIMCDIGVNRENKKINNPFYTSNIKCNPCDSNSIKCQILSKYVIAILNTLTGELVLHDLRTKDSFIHLPDIEEKYDNEIWALSEYDRSPSSFDYFGVLSNRKRFRVYDKRTNSVVVESIRTENPVNSCKNLKLKFCESGTQFSISGLDSLVRIYRLKDSGFDEVFIHEGHALHKSSSNLVTDHLWLKAGVKKMIVSVSENKTLNCWEFIA